MNSELDLTYLEEVTGGSSEMIVEMLKLFLNDTPDQLSSIERNVKNKDWEGIRAEAHKLKPTFQYVGLSKSHLEIAEVESKARNKEDLESILQLVHSVQNDFNLIQSEIKSKIEELSS